MRFEGEYYFDENLGFIKKLKKTVGKVLKPVEKALKPLVPKAVSKLVPKELKGGIEKPLALAAGGYGLYTLGTSGIAAGAAKAGSALATGAKAVGGAALTTAKVAAPIIGTMAATAGKVGTAVLEQAPNVMALQSAVNAQKAQAEINRIEIEAAQEAARAQRQHELDMMQIALAQGQSSIPPQAVVYPGASGPPSVSIMSPGASAAPGGMDQTTMLMLGGGAILVALMMRGRR